MRTIPVQGDVYLTPVTEVPADAKEIGTELRINSETGNVHALSGRVLQCNNGQQYIVIEKPALMEHPEHPPRQVEAGTYEVSTIGRNDFMPRERGFLD